MRIFKSLFLFLSLFAAVARGDMSRSGTLTTETWTAAAGPFTVTSSATIPTGVTITIEPGTQVYLAASANLIVASGGRLVAEGTEALPIDFSRVPGGAAWGNLQINGAAGTPETRIAYAQIDGNGGSPAILCN